ncbi:prepilin-type N-terminal cleavage/methylation domain-containing protein [Dethiobacter alkaliphilus]|uniref:prepilin-type N-terminal cleavage/methylation domain-containing protein n=1 Tax=Dethiobacter alkaliphilus TaxID=427926 RepID=UPI0023EEFB3E|nr:prepilin-type N-terminal cleavage/methylation domain-containing protein [Dethiobacter alkaliphilus]
MFKQIQKARKNQKGFTLVELMVVVVIIGVLVAIAIPIYGTVTQTAQDNAHEANIRTIKGAVQMLAMESDPPDVNIGGSGDLQALSTLSNYLEDTTMTTPRGSHAYTYYMENGEVFVQPLDQDNP